MEVTVVEAIAEDDLEEYDMLMVDPDFGKDGSGEGETDG